MGKKEKSPKVKKPIYKKWWFWVIIVLLGLGSFGSSDEDGQKTDNRDTKVIHVQDDASKSENQTEEDTNSQLDAGSEQENQKQEENPVKQEDDNNANIQEPATQPDFSSVSKSDPVSAPVDNSSLTNSNSGSEGSGVSSNKGGEWGSDSTTNEITGSLSKTSYWTTGGKSYHFSKSCPSLSRSKNIKSGTLQDALNAGKKDPCNNCANGS